MAQLALHKFSACCCTELAAVLDPAVLAAVLDAAVLAAVLPVVLDIAKPAAVLAAGCWLLC